MSGGHFDYKQHYIGDIADSIVMEIARAKSPLPPPTIQRERIIITMNHQERTAYLKGARDILMRLQECCDHYVIPYVRAYYDSKLPEFESALHSYPCPVANTKDRKMVGAALIKTLTQDKRSLERFLFNHCDFFKVTAVERNKKGQVTRVIISIE